METMKQQHDDSLRCSHCYALLPPQATACPSCGSAALSKWQEPASGVLRSRGQAQPERILVFFSYAHRDQTLRDHLENHLSILKYRGLITTWHAREISAGEELLHEIDIHLDSAHIILLLISANFLASQYCYGRAMMQALERHKSGQAHVIPVLLRPVLFTDAPFANLQPLPTNGKPVTRWKDREEAFYNIARGIERLVLELRAPITARAAGELAAKPALTAYTSFFVSNQWQIPGGVLLTCLAAWRRLHQQRSTPPGSSLRILFLIRDQQCSFHRSGIAVACSPSGSTDGAADTKTDEADQASPAA